MIRQPFLIAAMHTPYPLWGHEPTWLQMIHGSKRPTKAALSVFSSADHGATYYYEQEHKNGDDNSDNRARKQPSHRPQCAMLIGPNNYIQPDRADQY
jgi:hypothetical protein